MANRREHLIALLSELRQRMASSGDKGFFNLTNEQLAERLAEVVGQTPNLAMAPPIRWFEEVRGGQRFGCVSICDAPVGGPRHARCRTYTLFKAESIGDGHSEWRDACEDFEVVKLRAICVLDEWIRWAEKLMVDEPQLQVLSPRLNESEQKIVDVIRRAGHRLTTEEILAELDRGGHSASPGTTKATLAALVRHGLLTNRSDVTPRGYGLPEWD